MQNKKRIPVSDKVDYTPWEMPDLTGVKRRIAQRLSELEQQEVPSEEPVAELTLPSQEELAKLNEEARQEGYAAGFAEGQTAGNEEGRALGYKAGEEAGQEAGFHAGYQHGLGQAEQEVDQQLGRLQSIIEQLQGPLAALDQEVEAALLSLVDLVSRAILRREIKLERGFLTEVLQEAVAALPAGHQRLRISLNPEDLNLAEAACQDLLEDYRLVGDPEITLGGAKIETLQSLVDSTLENRYKKIIDKLLTRAYQPSTTDFEPLSNQVLSTPDTAPLEEAEFTEPKIPVPEQVLDTLDESASEVEVEPEADVSSVTPELEPEPVAQVSLQRGKAPRHQQPLKPLPNHTPDNLELAAKPLAEDEEQSHPVEKPINEQITPVFDTPELQELATDSISEQLGDESEVTPEEEPKEEVSLDQAVDEISSEASKAIEQEKNVAEVTDFLDEFVDDEQEAEPEVPSDSAVKPNEEVGKVTNLDQEAPADEAADWAPETVHDDRYLEDVLEKNWLDDMQEMPSDRPLDIIPDDEQGN